MCAIVTWRYGSSCCSGRRGYSNTRRVGACKGDDVVHRPIGEVGASSSPHRIGLGGTRRESCCRLQYVRSRRPIFQVNNMVFWGTGIWEAEWEIAH